MTPIFIPTRGRATVALQYTVAQLTPEQRERTFLVVRADEAQRYERIRPSLLGVKMLIRPESCVNLSFTLDWLIHGSDGPGETNKHIILCDDDIRFSYRRDPNKENQGKASPTEMKTIFQRIQEQLDLGYPMVGLVARQGCNGHFPHLVRYGSRQMQLHAINTEFFRRHQIRPRDVTVKSDFHMTLSVLEAGSFNAVIATASVDQAKGSNADGGVSNYRTVEVMNAGAKRLAELHPGVVGITQKTTEWKGLGNVTRDEVRIDWKRARASAKHPQDQ